jgi:hypothetical protein
VGCYVFALMIEYDAIMAMLVCPKCHQRVWMGDDGICPTCKGVEDARSILQREPSPARDRRPVSGIVILVLGVLTFITQPHNDSTIIAAGILSMVGIALILKLRNIFIVCLAVGFLLLDMCRHLVPTAPPH